MKLIEQPLHAPPSMEAQITAWRDGRAEHQWDTVVVEEPLEIRVAGCNVAVTMRTPGHDAELAAGFLFTEGIVGGRRDITSIAHCAGEDGEPLDNVLNVNPADHRLIDPGRWQRNFFATSSCGICGKASIDAVRQDTPPITSSMRVSDRVLLMLQDRLRCAQAVFVRTGGLHAAGLLDVQGRLRVIHEDVGRHNAVDKVIGHAVLEDLVPLQSSILMVSGRASFEIVQKALMAGIPVVAAVSAPSSLAVDLARESGMTLVGFLRQGRFNVYAGEERIVPSCSSIHPTSA